MEVADGIARDLAYDPILATCMRQKHSRTQFIAAQV
jgi:hypothetical protein